MILFFFNDTATTEIYTLSLHDALPISDVQLVWTTHHLLLDGWSSAAVFGEIGRATRLNSSHANISYAVFCLKKKQELRYGQTRLHGDQKSKRHNSRLPKSSYAVFRFKI